MSLRHPVACVNDLQIAICQSPELRDSLFFILFFYTRASLSSSKFVTLYVAWLTHLNPPIATHMQQDQYHTYEIRHIWGGYD